MSDIILIGATLIAFGLTIVVGIVVLKERERYQRERIADKRVGGKLPLLLPEGTFDRMTEADQERFIDALQNRHDAHVHAKDIVQNAEEDFAELVIELREEYQPREISA